MRIHTTANSEAMANAIARVFGPFDQLGAEAAVFNVASDNCATYEGGCWNFAESDDGQFGYWYPADQDTYAVACANYYQNDAMPAEAFGAACTLVAFNALIWHLHSRNVDSDIVDAASDLYHALRNWIFDLSEQGQIDGSAIAGFID
jgi:hypothetical protein